MGLCHGTSSNVYMIFYLYGVTKNPKYKYYGLEMHKFALEIPTLTDPEKMLSYDCLGQYSSFIDSAASSIATYSDLITYIDGREDQMWMIGWGKLSHHTQQKISFLSL